MKLLCSVVLASWKTVSDVCANSSAFTSSDAGFSHYCLRIQTIEQRNLQLPRTQHVQREEQLWWIRMVNDIGWQTLSNAVYFFGLGFWPTIVEAGFSYRPPAPPGLRTPFSPKRKFERKQLRTFCIQNLNVNVWCWLTRYAKTKGFRSEKQLRQTFERQKRVFREKLTLDVFCRCSKLFPCRNLPHIEQLWKSNRFGLPTAKIKGKKVDLRKMDS